MDAALSGDAEADGGSSRIEPGAGTPPSLMRTRDHRRSGRRCKHRLMTRRPAPGCGRAARSATTPDASIGLVTCRPAPAPAACPPPAAWRHSSGPTPACRKTWPGMPPLRTTPSPRSEGARRGPREGSSRGRRRLPLAFARACAPAQGALRARARCCPPAVPSAPGPGALVPADHGLPCLAICATTSRTRLGRSWGAIGLRPRRYSASSSPVRM
jgi:hypothetical protein